MPAITTPLVRVFRVNGRDLPDPAPGTTPERALELLALTDPSLNNGVLEAPVSGGGKLTYPIKINIGNKG